MPCARPLAAGPPVIPIALDPNARSRINMMGGRRGGDGENAAERQVEKRLTELDALWKARQAPPASVYQTLRAVVLPDARPAEVFLYPRPLAEGVGQGRARDQARAGVRCRDPGSLGRRGRCARRPAAAHQARQDQPGAELPGAGARRVVGPGWR